MPDITGLRSSDPAAKIVLLIAFTKVSAFNSTFDTPSSSGVVGNSSPFAPVSLYFPASLTNSIAKVSVSILNVKGMSGNAFRISSNIFAGIAIVPLSSVLTSSFTVIVVSRSLAEMTASPGARSNKK